MGYLSWILGFLGAIMLGLVKDEITAWLPRLARWCIHRAADRMPNRERWREEWLAHLDECPGKLGQLAHAFSVLGIGQLRRLRFWLEVIYFMPGLRWCFIDGAVSLIGIMMSIAFIYSWYASGDWTSVLAATSLFLAIASHFTERRAYKLLPIDRQMIKWAIAYHAARGTDPEL